MENLGDVFKKAREDKNLTIKDVSLQTNIGSKFIKAIENNDFSVFPGEAYTVGFIRNYAEFLKVDPEIIIKLFYTNQIAESETPIEELVAPTKPKLNPIPIILLTVVIVGIIVALIFIMRNKRSGEPDNTGTTSTTQTTQRQQETQTSQTASEPQGRYTELPFFDKKTIGDDIYIIVKEKKLKISIKKISNDGVDVVFSSVGDNDFLVNMRRTFTIGNNKQLKFDVERNREYDFSIGVDSIINQAQAKLFIRKVEDPYENQRYYDYFTYQAPDQATLLQLQGSGQQEQPSATPEQQTAQQGANPQQQANTQNTAQTPAQRAQAVTAGNTPQIKISLTNSMTRDSAIYIWVRKDNSPDIRTIKLNRNQAIQLDATSKLTLDTNNLYGLKIMINGREFSTRNISHDGGVGKLRVWIDRDAAGKPEIKYEINR